MSDAIDQCVKGTLDLGVIAIPVEGEAAPDAGNHLTDANFLHLVFQLPKQGWGAARFRAAPIKDQVEENLVQPACLGHFQQSQRVVN